MKYGRINQPVPNFEDDINALKDLLEKGEISQNEYSNRIEQFRKIRLAYIVATNGGYTPPKKDKRMWDGRLSELKERHLASKVLEYREQLINKAQETPPPEAE